MIKLYLPVCNSASFLETADIPLHFEVTVVDAGSTDQSVDIAENRGWFVLKQPHKIGRVENWASCVKHFIKSQASWCKWLFTGDMLYPNAHEILIRAILGAPEAKLIIFEYDIVEGHKRSRWKIFEETQLLCPPQTLWMTAKKGNWFGSPVGQCFHRDAVADGFSFGPWIWAADMQFAYEIAKEWPVLYVAESIGQFHVQARKTFSSQSNALSSSVEEYLVRMQAAREYLQLTDDRLGYEDLCKGIIQETESLIVKRAFSRGLSSRDTCHIFESIPIKQILRGGVCRVFEKLKGRFSR